MSSSSSSPIIMIELRSPNDLTEFIQNHNVCLVTFSATWCGPCKRSKPDLERLAMKPENSNIPFGYVYEHDLTDNDNDDDDDDNNGFGGDGDFMNTFATIFCKEAITGFPTYICFTNGSEYQRVNGVKLDDVQTMISTAAAASVTVAAGEESTTTTTITDETSGA